MSGVAMLGAFSSLITGGGVLFAESWLEWDQSSLTFPNNPDATKLVRRDYRDGWKIDGLG